MSPHLFSFNFSTIYKSDRNNKSTKIKLRTKTEIEEKNNNYCYFTIHMNNNNNNEMLAYNMATISLNNNYNNYNNNNNNNNKKTKNVYNNINNKNNSNNLSQRKLKEFIKTTTTTTTTTTKATTKTLLKREREHQTKGNSTVCLRLNSLCLNHTLSTCSLSRATSFYHKFIKSNNKRNYINSIFKQLKNSTSFTAFTTLLQTSLQLSKVFYPLRTTFKNVLLLAFNFYNPISCWSSIAS